MFHQLNWVQVNQHKLCPVLYQKLMATSLQRQRLPGFLQSTVTRLALNMARYKVIVQINGEHYFSTLNTDNLGGILGCQINHRFDMINAFSTTVNIKGLQQLVTDESVTRVWHDYEVKALLNIAAPTVGAPPVWNTGVKGKGIGIAILDSGIYPHPDLTTPGNRIIAFRDFIHERSKPYDDNGHGTHCAGDAAGNGFKSNGRYKGPAPKANLIGVKVIDKNGTGSMSQILAGIQWCIDHKNKYGIKILSMSLGTAARESYKKDPLCQAVRKAWKAGLVVCAAAGNDGPGTGTINSPGIEPTIITVGALNDRNTMDKTDDYVARFSSRGPTIDGFTKPDLVAPGEKITSLSVPRSYLNTINPDAKSVQWYSSLSGTSMAAPICAGVAALILSKSPKLTPDEVKRLLKATCRKVDSDPNVQGAGLINAKSAVQA